MFIHKCSLAFTILACLFLFGCTNVRASQLGVPGVHSLIPEFNSIAARLQNQTQLPIVLPTKVPVHPFYAYADPDAITANSYEVSLSARPNCDGAGACMFGSIAGERITSKLPSIQQQFAYETDPSYNPTGRSPEKSGYLILAKGITGYFAPFVCTISCNESRVVWEQNGCRYTFGIKLGRKSAVVNMANSAINNSQ